MTTSQKAELTTFACACTDRIDRVVRTKSDRWSIALSWSGKCFVAIAMAVASGGSIEVRGSGRRPAFAIWDALSQIEALRRELTS